MSASVKAPVTPSVLKWARETAGYDIKKVVTKLNQKRVQEETVWEWESGNSEPSYAQLKKLAGWYKRPEVLFFFPEPPRERSVESRLRSLPASYAKELPPEVRFLVRKGVNRQSDLGKIYDGNAPEEYQKFKFEIVKEFRRKIEERDAFTLASYIRNYLRITLQEQLSWKDPAQALKRWREAVENLGIWVFKDAFRNDDYSGFSLPDERFPVIYINNSTPPQRQVFTLFHELAHQLKHKGGVAFRETYQIENRFLGEHRDEEVFCNAFAGELLVPREGLPVPSSKSPRNDEISSWARKFKVSREVMLRRWLDNRQVSKSFYSDTIAQWRNKYEVQPRKSKKSDGNYYATQVAYLGGKYLTKVLRQYYDRRIVEHQVAGYFGVRIRSLAKVQEYALKAKIKVGY